MTLSKAASVGEWAVFQDVLHESILREQHHALVPYLPFAAMAYHFLYAGNDVSPIRWPRTQQEASGVRQRSEAMLGEWTQALAPGLQRFITPRLMRLDVVGERGGEGRREGRREGTG